MAPYKNVAVVGANGVLGAPIINALVAGGFNVTVLTRKAVPTEGVKNVIVDYEDSASLEAGFKGQEVVVSLVGAPGLEGQTKLIDAAIAAGVKRFVPSEFGVDVTAPGAEKILFLGGKIKIEKYLEEKEAQIEHTFIYTNIFLDWALANGFLGVDIKAKKATVWDEGKAPFVGTNLADVGKGVAGLLSNPEPFKNKAVRLASVVTTIADVVAEFEKQTGQKFEITKESIPDVEAKSKELVDAGEFVAGGFLNLKVAILNGKGTGYWTNDDDAALGVEKTPLAEIVKAVITSA